MKTRAAVARAAREPLRIEEVELAAQGLDGVGQVIRPEPPPPGASVC